MRCFFCIFAMASAVLCLSFIAWIVTRAMLAETANRLVGHVMVADLCAVALMLAYSAFAGTWLGSARPAARDEGNVDPPMAPYVREASSPDSG
jgi:hypothetical protein